MNQPIFFFGLNIFLKDICLEVILRFLISIIGEWALAASPFEATHFVPTPSNLSHLQQNHLQLNHLQLNFGHLKLYHLQQLTCIMSLSAK